MPIFVKNDRCVLFVHIPKTGGTAVERTFQENGYETLYLDRRSRRARPKSLLRCSPQHMHASMLDQLFRLEIFDLVFTVVRDPLARFKSEYLWRNRNSPNACARQHVRGWTSRVLAKYAVDPFVNDNHIRPQSDFLLPGVVIHRLEAGLGVALTDLSDTHGLGLTAASLPATPTGVGLVRSEAVPISTEVEARLRHFYQRDYARLNYE